MLRTAYLFHCVIALCVAQQPQSDNIDTFQPVMRSSPEMGTFDGDLFGYTAVLHKPNRDGGVGDTQILVSAPYGQAINSQLGRQGNLPSTGVIYTCPVTAGECMGLTGNGRGEDRRLYDSDRNAPVVGESVSDGNEGEEKRGQFLGATLKSTGDTFLACGHRHLDFGAGLDRNPYGVCYFSGGSLTGFRRYSPCRRSSRSFFGHGQCQAGTSGDIIDGNILVGAPGTFSWNGAVFRRDDRGAISGSSSGVGTGSSTISWQGYEVTTGNISSQNIQDFIVSVPRASGYRGRVNIYQNNNEVLRPVGNPPLSGTQVGEYYGFAMAAVDLQGQRSLDDLLISAPMYSPGVNSPEFGRVYVYRNDQGALSSAVFTLVGTIPYGRFGHAIANLGDINADGYEDVAISAPFGEGVPGTVYIYAGAGSSLIRQDPIQIIVGSDLNLNPPLSNFISFGSSLSSGVDVDGNGYNDLVIGAFRSQRVFVLRTRPVARLQVTVDSESSVDLRETPARCGNMPCFRINVSMIYDGEGLENTLNVNYTLEVDPSALQQGLPSRVNLNSTSQTILGRIRDNVVLRKNEIQYVAATAILRSSSIVDITSAFIVQFTPTLVDTRVRDASWNGNGDLMGLNMFPVLSVIGETAASTQYVTNCGNNTVCQPDLQVTVLENNVTYENSDGNILPDANSIVSGVTTAMEIPVVVVNNGDDAFGARISVTFDRVLTLSRVVPPAMGNMQGVPLTCTDRDDSVSCTIANQFFANETRMIIFRFQTNAVRGSEQNLQVFFNVTSVTPEISAYISDNVAMLNITTEANIDLSLQMSLSQESIVLGETNPETIEDIADFAPFSSMFDTTISITNRGTTTVPRARLSIYWPLNAPVTCDDPSMDVACRRFYLYPIGVDGLTCNTTYLNILRRDLESLGDDSTENSGSKRRRRQLTEVSNVTEVSCANGRSDACVEIVCDIRAISRTIRATIQAIPDNRQFFGNPTNFNFTIHSVLRVVGEFEDVASNSEAMVTLVGIAVVAPQSGESDDIPAWVIIVPIIVGVLIIFCIVIALYFLGFFKLKKVDKEKDEEELNQDGNAPDGDKQPEGSNL